MRIRYTKPRLSFYGFKHANFLSSRRNKPSYSGCLFVTHISIFIPLDSVYESVKTRRWFALGWRVN